MDYLQVGHCTTELKILRRGEHLSVGTQHAFRLRLRRA
jgi:hypothetical protein